MPELTRLRQTTLEWRLVEGEVVVLDLDRSEYLLVNRTGATLWPLLADGASRDQMADHLVQRYGLAQDHAAADVEVFMRALADRRLLEA